MQFGHVDPASLIYRVEHGAKCQPHSKTANQDSRAGRKPSTRAYPQFFFGPTLTAVHQDSTTEADQKVIRIALSKLEDAIWGFFLTERLPGTAQFILSRPHLNAHRKRPGRSVLPKPHSSRNNIVAKIPLYARAIRLIKLIGE
jgi:hypothetical protein